MNILFLGSDALLARLRRQTVGQSWDIYQAQDADHVLDFAGTHVFQAAVIGLCSEARRFRPAAQNAKAALDVPVVIGLASQDQAVDFSETSQQGVDIVLPDCGNDRLTKLQCDTILRLANGVPTESITCGDVRFDLAENRFSVKGEAIHLPQKKHKLLELLFLKRGRTVSKEMMFNHLYGWDEPPEAKIIDVFVCQIRRILREAGVTEDCIQTVWGRGYLVPDASPVDGRKAA